MVSDNSRDLQGSNRPARQAWHSNTSVSLYQTRRAARAASWLCTVDYCVLENVNDWFLTSDNKSVHCTLHVVHALAPPARSCTEGTWAQQFAPALGRCSSRQEPPSQEQQRQHQQPLFVWTIRRQGLVACRRWTVSNVKGSVPVAFPPTLASFSRLLCSSAAWVRGSSCTWFTAGPEGERETEGTCLM
jgi:hypothetical protein